MPVYAGAARRAARGGVRMGPDSTSRAWPRSRRPDARRATRRAYQRMRRRRAAEDPAGDVLRRAGDEPRRSRTPAGCDGLHVDLVRAPDAARRGAGDAPGRDACSRSASSTAATSGAPTSTLALADRCAPLHALGGDRLCVAPSCSLLHVPFDLDARDRARSGDSRPWLAFAPQKLDELRRAGAASPTAMRPSTRCASQSRARGARQPRAPRHARATAPCATRWRRVTGAMLTPRERRTRERRAAQRARFGLPALPDDDDRLVPADRARSAQARAAWRAGKLDDAELRALSASEIAHAASREQEELGLDVLVHGESERNDMVEYFGEQLDGFAFTAQRLGAVLRLALREAADHLRRRRRARADDGRVDRATRSRSPTKPMKGMLTGPGHDPAVVVRARRPAARGDLPPDRARDPRRGRRPRGGRHRA